MATNILALPELSIPCTIRTNEDWLDAIAFWDVNGNPVALDGIPFRLQARAAAGDADVLLEASTDNGLLTLCSAGALVRPVAPGAGYLVGDTVFPAGGTCIVPATLVVTALALSGLGGGGGYGGGTGHAVGDVLTLGGGVAAAPAMVMVDTVGANGAITAAHILAPGAYTVTPASLAQAATTGTGTGAAFTAPLWGIAAAKMTSAGTYAVVPANPVAQGSSSGAGQGAAFALTWINNALGIAIPLASIADYLVASAKLYEVRAQADGYTRSIIVGDLAVIPGIVR